MLAPVTKKEKKENNEKTGEDYINKRQAPRMRAAVPVHTPLEVTNKRTRVSMSKSNQIQNETNQFGRQIECKEEERMTFGDNDGEWKYTGREE